MRILTKLLILSFTILGCSTIKTGVITNPTDPSSGTVFNLAYNGQLYGITAAHVCSKAGAGGMALITESSITRIPILAQDNGLDLCVLAPIPGLPPLSLYMGEDAPTSLSVVGHPFGMRNEFSFPGSLLAVFSSPRVVPVEETGECSVDAVAKGKDRNKRPVCLVIRIAAVTDAQAYVGNSGGPVINDKNEVVGVLQEVGLPDGTPSFFLPSPRISSFLDLLNER